MEIVLILGFALGIGAAVWGYFAIRGLRRAVTGTATGPMPTAMVELSVLAGLLAAIRGAGNLSFLAMVLPPLSLVAVPSPTEFSGVAVPALMAGVPVAVIALWVGRRVLPRGIGAILMAGLLALGAGLIAAERTSLRAMCETARTEGLSDVRRYSVFWSFAAPPAEDHFEIHGLARQDDAVFGWSYSQMRWYPIPPNVLRNVNSGGPACGL